MVSLRPTANRRFNELIGLLLGVAAALLLLALLSYHPADPSLDTAGWAQRPENWVGPVGAWLADLLFQGFGIAAFLLVAGLGAWARTWLVERPASARGTKPAFAWAPPAGLLLTMIALGAVLAQAPWQFAWRAAVPWQGMAGALFASVLVGWFNPIGGFIVTLTALLVGVFLCTKFSFAATADWLALHAGPKLAPAMRPLLAPYRAWTAWRETRRQRIQSRRAERAAALAARRPAKIVSQFIPSPGRPGEAGAGETLVPASVAARLAAAHASQEAAALAPVAAGPPPDSDPVVAPVTPRAAPAARAKIRSAAGAYRLPSPALLQEAALGERVDENELRALAAALTSKCSEFDVRGQVVQINPGPVVTTYEYKPEAGIKYSRITALNEDLCLALEAESIYIERIPGKSTVGIEVPNRRRETIFLREVVESSEFHASASPLTVALGKDIAGRIVTADLAAMPHLLIAGSTGSGKSVALNSIIVSLLYKSTPDEVRLILVDPKRLELGLYDGIPHLYTPIITEPKLAASALRNATREMERRLKLLAAHGVRNIAQFNRLFEKAAPGLFDQLEADPDNRPLPYIVIVIDELADLMIVDANNVEESITRLAQMARAVGIHLILATQRPSVDVITGLIKANFPARISFRVATKVDSRTILDAQGAESLLGKGDMLFLPPGTSRLHRVHGAYVTEREITGVVEFWAQQAQPEFDETFLRPPAEEEAPSGLEGASGGEAGGAGEAGGDDPMFEDAVRVVLEYGKASTSLLQRRLRIGYGRAAHLIDLMYNDGIVGPADGPKPREVLKRPDWLAEVDEALR